MLVSSSSQILLKKSALKTYRSRIYEYLNPYVIIGYALFLLCSLASVFCYKIVPLTTGTIIETTAYIFIPTLSFIFLKEKISARQLVGILVIITGIVIYSIGGTL